MVNYFLSPFYSIFSCNVHFAVVKPCFIIIIIIIMFWKLDKYIIEKINYAVYLLVYFQIDLSCAVMILLLKEKRSVCASQTRSACTHSNKEMETSSNGADCLHSRTVKQRNGSFCTSTQTFKEESSCSVYIRKRQSCEFTRPAKEKMSQRVHVSSLTQAQKETDQA